MQQVEGQACEPVCYEWDAEIADYIKCYAPYWSPVECPMTEMMFSSYAFESGIYMDSEHNTEMEPDAQTIYFADGSYDPGTVCGNECWDPEEQRVSINVIVSCKDMRYHITGTYETEPFVFSTTLWISHRVDGACRTNIINCEVSDDECVCAQPRKCEDCG